MARGGARPGAGRKPGGGAAKPAMGKLERKVAATKVPDRAPLVPAEARPDFPAIDPRVLQMMLPEIEEISKRYAVNKSRDPKFNPFQLPTWPKGVEPPGSTMAMDNALSSNLNFGAQAWLTGDTIGGLSGEGMLFLGYTYLSELAQRPEFRVISETIADDATRKWIDFDVTGDERQAAEKMKKDPKGEAERALDPDEREKRIKASGKLDKIKILRDDQLRLGVKDRFYEQARNDGFFGRSHLYLDIDTNKSGDVSPDELKLPLGDSRDEMSASKVPKDSFRALRTIEPVWTYPLAYNAINPLRADWYNPQTWYVMGQEIHGSRLQTFIGHPVPDMLKPAYAFGGLSLSQMAKPYVDIWLTTRESVGTLIHSFSVMVLMTDLSTQMQPGNVNALLARVAMFNMLRDNQGTFVVNKNTEDFKNVSASLSGLHELQAQSQEHMAAVSRIPLVKLTGISPAGLNASSEGEILVYDDTIMAYQSRFFSPNLTKVINFEQLSCFGEIDPEITWHFQTLRQPTEAEKGDLQKKKSERDQIYVDIGSFSPGEIRKVVIDDPDSPFAGLDPDDVPEPPDPMGGEGGDPFGGGDDEQGDGGGKENPAPKAGEGASDAEIADFFAHDAAWNEADHDRAPDGKFGSGGGSSKPAVSPKGLKKTGSRMGSNEGGVFETPQGEKLYIKRPASKAHVENERAAARLYQLAGVNTLNYRDVEGGNHVATELVKLDKNNISKMSPAERKEAAKDFVVHAWLSNWDAAGTGGDNQGIVDGKVTTLDVGGSLRYRAQGGPKGKAFGPKVTELETMRNPSMSPDAARLYGKMTDAELADAAAKVTSIKNDDIRKAVGGDQELADTLIARKKDIADQFKLATDDAPWDESKHPRAPDGKFGSGGGGSSGESEGAQMLTLATLLSKPPIAGANYRRQLVKAIKTAQGSQKQKLTENLIASWVKTGINAASKGDIQAAGKIVDKVTALGGDPTAIKSAWSAAKPAEPAPQPAATAKKVEKIIEAPPPEPLPAPTEAELQKAKKATPTNVSLLGGPTTGPFAKTAQEIVEKFNEKYASKEITDKPGLIQKVHDFKALKAGMGELGAAHEKHLAEIAAVAKAEAIEKGKKQAAALKAEQEAAKEKNRKYMKELGISETEASGFDALVAMTGGSASDMIEKFKNYEAQAKKLGYPISGFQYALIRNYINGGYVSVNESLRAGSMTAAQHVYARLVNSAIDKLPKFTGTVTRGTTLDASQLAAYKPGHVVAERAFTSTGVNFKFGGNVSYTIKAIGKRGGDFSTGANVGEKEVLFKTNTYFLVHKVEKKGSVTHIEMEEVEHHG